jgi:GlcNAc-P-P-Und epimerase
MTKSSVLITGASGFLGKYIFDQFDNGSWDIVSIGRHSVLGNHVHLSCDLASQVPTIPDSYYEKVVHVAGKAHVFPKTKEEIESFYKVNVQGTKNLLAALDRISKKPSTIVFISSVAVYGRAYGKMLTEETTLDAETPYGKTKLEGEELVKNWAIKNKVDYLLLRLPLIVGINPPGNLGVLKNAILKGHYLRMKGNFSQKSIVAAPDVADLIYNIHHKSGVYNLTDGRNPTFHEIELAIQKRLGRKIRISIPLQLVKILAKIGDLLSFIIGKQMILTSDVLMKISSDLTFDDNKARKDLNWNPSSAIEFVEKHL